jgi:hypothetical protein
MRRALIVGIDNYPQSPLSGCVNDAKILGAVLARHYDGGLDFHCEVITSETHTINRAFLREKICRLFRDHADVAYFHFSGHGTINDFGGYLVTTDYCDYDMGIPMAELLALANQSPVNNIFITLDCCHSGSLGIAPVASNDRVILSNNVSIITATRCDQAALEENGTGVFTSLLVEALDGGAAALLGEVTAASVYAYIDNSLGAWDQRPLFKANVSEFIKLRKAKPKIEIQQLRKITQYFPLPAEQLPLSPEYEPTVEPHDSVKEAIIIDLRKFKDVGLIELFGTEHLYGACMNSKSCGLTTLGKYYWRLVKDNKI